MSKPKKIILCPNPYRDKDMTVAARSKEILDQEGFETVVCLPFQKEGYGAELGVPIQQLDREIKRADLLIAFGGDGTILHLAKTLAMNRVPVLGINLGSLGFMSELEPDELERLRDLKNWDLSIENRMMLDVSVVRDGRTVYNTIALNDAVISKGSIARVVELDVLADRTLVTSVTGDGVIVATPTGSPAYSMAAGGPIVEPTSQAIIVTPVCAHRLTARAMVLSMDRVVTIALPKTARKCLYLSVDGGKAIRLNGGDRVEVKRSRHSTQLVQLTHRNFYQLVNQKLGGAAQ